MTIRPLSSDEIASLVHLCGEHAAYEKVEYAPEGKREHLRRAIAAEFPRLWCLVAEIDSRIVGYATCTRDFSTWRAAEHLYLDCLYIIPEFRGLGIGTRMMQAVRRYATSLGCATVEWQTPAWNVDGRIFSRVLGNGPQKRGDAQ